MVCTEQSNLDWRDYWRWYCNNNYINTGYIVNGGSYYWNNLLVENLGAVQIGSYWYIRIRITWPWGHVETFDWWECWGQWRDIVSTNESAVYDGRYDYVNYSHGLYLFCNGATTLAGGRIELEIGYRTVSQNEWLIDIINGNDNWSGLNWDYPKKTLTAGAQSVANNKALWIASGDYTVAPGTTAVIAPTNLASGGQIQYVIKDPRNTGIFQFSCGERLSAYIAWFARTEWGQMTKWYKSATQNYEWIKGFESSLTTLVSSDALFTGNTVVEILINDNTEGTLYTGSTLLLEQGYKLEIHELNMQGNLVRVELKKGSTSLDMDWFPENTTYQYWEDVNGVYMPIINIYIRYIFAGTETNSIRVKGIFQVSDIAYVL